MKIKPVILCGGSGTRLWPISTPEKPKQFHALCSDKTLFQQTLLRAGGVGKDFLPTVVANHSHALEIDRQASAIDLQLGQVILEPEPRNTAAAIMLAAFDLLNETSQSDTRDLILLVMPSDHIIGDEDEFVRCVEDAKVAIEKGLLVTFGITPSRPETGYGYIQLGVKLSGSAYSIAAFKEKPDLNLAIEFCSSGQFLWNSGIFMFGLNDVLDECRRLIPLEYHACEMAYKSGKNGHQKALVDRGLFQKVNPLSFDYGVMERTTRAAVVPMNARWSDLGSWQSIWEQSDRDPDDNVLSRGVVNVNSKGCLVLGDDRPIAINGLRNTIVIDSPEGLLVSNLSDTQDVKRIPNSIEALGFKRAQNNIFQRFERPWGSYEILEVSDSYQVKRIIIRPGQKISLQKHKFRSERWVVVEGSLKVTKNQEEMVLQVGQAEFIPVGAVHRAENIGNRDATFIEVQTGSYLGEDDIERIQDDYGRV